MQIEPSNIKKWNIIYPVYINSKKTVAEGRRISTANACENPTCVEISDCCNYLKIPCVIEVSSSTMTFFLGYIEAVNLYFVYPCKCFQ